LDASNGRRFSVESLPPSVERTQKVRFFISLSTPYMGELEQEQDAALNKGNPQESDEERKARRKVEQDNGAKAEALRQKALADKREALLVKEAVTRAKTDEGYLLKLAEDDPDAADKAAKQLSHNGKAFKDLGEYKQYLGMKGDGDKFDMERRIQEQVEQRFQDYLSKQSMSGVDKVKETMLSKFTSEETRAKAEAKWNLLSKAVTSTESAEEIAEMVLSTVKVDKKAKTDEKVMNFGSVPTGSRRPTETKPQWTDMDRALGLHLR
jgi:hypothetical protein